MYKESGNAGCEGLTISFLDCVVPANVLTKHIYVACNRTIRIFTVLAAGGSE